MRTTAPVVATAHQGVRKIDELFSPVRGGRISQVIVEQIRTLMREGRLKPGDRLPSERAMCEAFGVSRVTLREALRILEANGLIQIRVGARGGATVIEPGRERMRQSIADLVALSSLTGAELTEAVLEILAETLQQSAYPVPFENAVSATRPAHTR